MLTPPPSDYLAATLLEDTVHTTDDTDSDGGQWKALQAHIRNPILGIRLVEPADDAKGKHVESERGRECVAWGRAAGSIASDPPEQGSGERSLDGLDSDLDAENEERTPKPSRLVVKTHVCCSSVSLGTRSYADSVLP